jgi:hypothetical protein
MLKKINVLITFILVTSVSGLEAHIAVDKNPTIIKKGSLEDRWGIHIKGIRLSAAGYMLDFRYRVIDPDKAKPIFKRQTKPYLIDQASGAKFIVPTTAKLGPIRNSNMPQIERTYFMFFANPGRYVKSGNKVTVVIGDFRAENLIVE